MAASVQVSADNNPNVGVMKLLSAQAPDLRRLSRSLL
jgi:hypothetical protein